MKINKASPNSYNDVARHWVADYIQGYAYKIHYIVNENGDTMRSSGDTKANTRLKNADKTQLKAIAAELETVLKRLEYIMEGRY